MNIKFTDKLLKEVSGEDDTITKLVSLGISKYEAQNIIMNMDFTQYIELMDAMSNDDTDTIQQIIDGVVVEGDNAYLASPSTTSTTTPTSTNTTNTKNAGNAGNAVTITSDDGQTETGEIIDDNISGDTVKVKTATGMKDVKRADLSTEVDEEIKRMKQLAGIEETISSGGVISSGAMAGVCVPMSTIKRQTHVNKKSGPKVGSKNAKKKPKK